MSASATDGTVTFLDAFPPPLEAGNYTMTLKQSVSESTRQEFTNQYAFSVLAPRFVLDPTLIHSMFPPPAHQAQFSNYLAQVVFTRRTLPWERTLDGKPPEKPGTVLPPWLGVLLFDEQDLDADQNSLVPAVETSTVGALLASDRGGSRPSGVFGPDFGADDLEPGQDLTDQCMVIDVDSAFFQQIAPSLEDLQYLAHARQVDPSKKIHPGGPGEDGWVSVVVGNRFPKPGSDEKHPCKNTAFLVSYEGLQGSLHGGTKITEPVVRLVCLASWTFNDVGETASFEQLMQELDVGEDGQQPGGRLHLQPKTSAASGPAQAVQDALLQGFTALDHVTRQGESTVSWNRGPLVPLVLDAPDPPPVRNSSDAALRYDPSSGLFDVSYAAAWQIGRLLALNDKLFSTTLLDWRRRNQQEAAQALTRQRLHQSAGGLVRFAAGEAHPLAPHAVKPAVLAFLQEEVMAKLVPADPAAEPLLGRHPDPSGLAGFGDALPGLLRPEEVADILRAEETLEAGVEALCRRIFGATS